MMHGGWPIPQRGSIRESADGTVLQRVLLACLLLIAPATISLGTNGTSPCHAAESIRVETEVDREQVSLNEPITLTVRVIGQGLRSLPSPELPALDAFEIVGSSTASSVTVINRELSAMETRKYVLIPLQTGRVTIDPIVVRYGGEKYSTEPITIIVKQDKSQAPAGPKAGRLRKRPEYLPSGKRSEAIVTLESDKTEAYVGEQITLTFTFYQRVSLGDGPLYMPPSTPGFWVEDMPKPEPRRGVVRNREYFIDQFQYALFGTASGDATVGPAALKVVIDPFAKPVKLTTEAVELRILPLPEDEAPEDFTGAVGSFRLSQEASATVIDHGEPFTLRVTISGQGNLRTVPNPAFPETEHFKAYTSKVEENYRFLDGILNSKKTVEYVLIPKRPGQQRIESISFSYFDPREQAYKTLRTEPIVVTARPGTVVEQHEPGLSAQQEITALGEDIRFIKTTPFLRGRKHPYLYQQPAFIAAQAIPLLAIGGAILYRRHRERQRTESTTLRSKRAKEVSLKRLKRAQRLLRPETSDQFYAELSGALSRYIEDKLHLPTAQLTKAAIATKLMEKGMTAEEAEDIQHRLAACDYVRFAPISPSADEMNEAYHLVEHGILALEKRLR